MELQARWADGDCVQIHGAPWRAGFTAGAFALQGADDTSSSEGSTVDFLDPEEILRKIPEKQREPLGAGPTMAPLLFWCLAS